VAIFIIGAGTSANPQDPWPQRVVITNDDGIAEQQRLFPMAEAFARVAETYVVVPRLDRSGTTHYLSWSPRQRALQVERILQRPASEESHTLTVYVVDGYPADCVLFAHALLAETPPDLLISGPNGGANLGESWMFSGTIGAARIASLLGWPAIAVSGLQSDWPEAATAVADWTVRLAQSPAVRGLESGQYLTVGLPRKKPGQIRGVRLARRRQITTLPSFTRGPKLAGSGDLHGELEVWLYQPPASRPDPPAGSDEDLWNQDYIVITPMRADEHDPGLMQKLAQPSAAIPDWTH